MDIMLQFSHHSIDGNRENYTEIDMSSLFPMKLGMNIDLLDFIEDSPHGVILFIFGSTIAMSSVPKNILTAFKKALADLPQRVLLKY
ncbi:unnamed protein product [Macrosiphum euphorbiae]|uniref:Glucuronosyltransferase n=1 Tax=Macrosiphum euphorbiae TaxID=13131 RepID=A0AAV0VXA7_9HEMI|nr:unnamed protein product [Macrosiphum euphorbiae]